MNRNLTIIPLLMLLLSLTGIKTASAVDFDLWVGGVRVNDYNCDKIPVARGKASYDSSSKTLTLENAYIKGTGTIRDEGNGAGIYVGAGMTVEVIGTNVLEGADECDGLFLYGNEEVQLTGSGTLIAAGYYGVSLGAYVPQLTVRGQMTLIARGSSAGLGGCMRARAGNYTYYSTLCVKEQATVKAYGVNSCIRDWADFVLGNGHTLSADVPVKWDANAHAVCNKNNSDLAKGQWVTVNAPDVSVGDVNEDGDVNINDVVAIINQMAGTASWKNADVNGDTKVDINDVVSVINIMASGGSVSPKPKPVVEKTTYAVNNVSFTMVTVEGGIFRMGSEDSEAQGMEKPVHEVLLPTYAIGQTEVTQKLWTAVMGSNPSMDKGDDLPVGDVSWNDCQTFITKLNALTGKRFRLPTEAEWEFAARGGNLSEGYKYSGSNNIDAVAWYLYNSENKVHAVATKAPNELGLYDMSGNVSEWCQDKKGSYSSDFQINPIGSFPTSYRVQRGGDLFIREKYCRVSSREFDTPDGRSNLFGLRLALGTQPQTTYTANGVEFTMIDVEGGTFRMGSNDSDAESDEKPVHNVTLSDYAIGQTEVTQALWKAVMDSNPSEFIGDNLPVDNVSWNDCQTFITKLNKLTGEQFRLPTEAEWEYAARGGNKNKGYKYSGSDDADAVAWYQNNSDEIIHAVATKAPNQLGIYDMSGNVREWCHDWLGDYSSAAQTNPTGPVSGSYRVFRGGDFRGQEYHSGAWDCRVSSRGSNYPTSGGYTSGLRLVLGPPLPTTYTVNGVSFTMISVEGGVFQMGSDTGEADERPVHPVQLSSFAIGQTEVTQKLWKAVMGNNPSHHTSTSGKLPVEQVSWDDCQTFITKLNTITGKQFRLPTEAEWEYAACGGSYSKGYIYSGSNDLHAVAWHIDSYNYTFNETQDVATKAPNELGIYDMSGNVSEWCQDCYTQPYLPGLQINPIFTRGNENVCRGGGFQSSGKDCRVTKRDWYFPNYGKAELGFRLAL